MANYPTGRLSRPNITKLFNIFSFLIKSTEILINLLRYQIDCWTNLQYQKFNRTLTLYNQIELKINFIVSSLLIEITNN